MAQYNVIPASTGSFTMKAGDRSIGAILVDAGKLTPDEAERVLRAQRELGLRFGDAAIHLGMITQADVDLAISRQFNYPYLLPGNSEVSESLVAAYTPFTRPAELMRALRSQLMLRWCDADVAKKALAVVSAEGNEGRSFVSANLAIVFSQLGEHTLLIDGDMRNPSQHELFGLENRTGLSGVLSSRSGVEAAVRRIPSLLDLSVLPAGVCPPNPQELLARPQFADMLDELARKFDVILVDTPAAGEYADAQTVAARAGAALIVARKNKTPMSKALRVAEDLTQAKATVVGTVLNNF